MTSFKQTIFKELAAPDIDKPHSIDRLELWQFSHDIIGKLEETLVNSIAVLDASE
jgi:hypothetical protein